MRVRLAYGKNGLSIELPDDPAPVVVEPGFTPGATDQAGLVRDVLRNPVASRPLRELASSRSRVGIVFSDITRPTPYHVLLPALLGELDHVPRDNFVLFNATGTHRANTSEELEQILGPGIVGTYRIVQNDADDASSHVLVGTTRGGNDVHINREFMSCDLKIPTGFIEPHFFAGFSGGGKAIMPGLAGLQTIARNHSAAHMDHRRVGWGITAGNPLWEEIREAARMTKPGFILNVALNRNQEITAVFAGDFLEAHRRGCEYVRENSMTPVDGLFDIVVTSNSGHPLDLNLYQSVKGMSAAFRIVKDGGHIIVAAECWDGVPDHGSFRTLLAAAAGPGELLRRIRRPGFMAPDMWQAQIHASICERVTVHFHSDGLSDRQIRDAFMEPCPDIGDRVRELLDAIGPEGRVCVLPEGPQTIAYVATGPS